MRRLYTLSQRLWPPRPSSQRAAHQQLSKIPLPQQLPPPTPRMPLPPRRPPPQPSPRSSRSSPVGTSSRTSQSITMLSRRPAECLTTARSSSRSHLGLTGRIWALCALEVPIVCSRGGTLELSLVRRSHRARRLPAGNGMGWLRNGHEPFDPWIAALAGLPPHWTR